MSDIAVCMSEQVIRFEHSLLTNGRERRAQTFILRGPPGARPVHALVRLPVLTGLRCMPLGRPPVHFFDETVFAVHISV
jgi:hypothetical protein